jgi:hypothetical protein
MVLEVRQGRGRGAAEDLLEMLGQLAADRYGAIRSKGSDHILQRAYHAMRRLKHQQGDFTFSVLAQELAASRARSRQEPEEGERMRRQA